MMVCPRHFARRAGRGWLCILMLLLLMMLSPPSSVQATIGPMPTPKPTPSITFSAPYVGWKYFKAQASVTSAYTVVENGFRYWLPGVSEPTWVKIKTISSNFSTWILPGISESSESRIVECESYLKYYKNPADKMPTLITSGTWFIYLCSAPEFVVTYSELTSESVKVRISVDPQGNTLSYLWIFRDRIGHGVDSTELIASDVHSAGIYNYWFTGWNSLTPGTRYAIYPVFQTYDQMMNAAPESAAPGITITALPLAAPTLSPTAAPTTISTSHPTILPSASPAVTSGEPAVTEATTVEPTSPDTSMTPSECATTAGSLPTDKESQPPATPTTHTDARATTNIIDPSDQASAAGNTIMILLVVLLIVISMALIGIFIVLLKKRKRA